MAAVIDLSLQGSLWKLGVAWPIENHSFRYGKHMKRELNGAHSSGTSTINLMIVIGDPTWRDNYDEGDVVYIGPNSSGYVGRHRIVSFNSDTQFVITPSLQQDFANSDPVYGIGSCFPGSWDCLLGTFGDGGYPYRLDGTLSGDEGIDDGHRLRALIVYDASLGGDRIISQTGNRQMLPGVVYRFGLWYKLAKVGGSTQVVASAEELGVAPAMISMTLADKTVWTHIYDTGTPAVVPGKVPKFELTFSSLSNPGDQADLHLDCPYLLHASDTDGSSDGVFTFTEIPVAGSIVIDTEEAVERKDIADATGRMHDPAGEKGKARKFTVAARFSRVTSTFADNLITLLQWQERGNLLALFPYIDNVSPLLIGRLEVDGFRKDFYDPSKASFDFVFREL